MGINLSKKILSAHLVNGSLEVAEECSFRVDHTLVHDMSGLLAFMGIASIDVTQINISLPLMFMDHNLVAMDSSSPDDQNFLRSCAKRFGLCFSRPGNGVCHTLYSGRFGRPGAFLLGADSHTATAGALGMLGIGVGGMDVATVLAGEPFRMKTPLVMEVRLEGQLRPGVSAKDVALTLLLRLKVNGGVGKILEYTGNGVSTLTVPQRATIANMGAEMGATSSVFPADDQVRRFLAAQGREEDYQSLLPDKDAEYDQRVELDLGEVRPMVALPGQPDYGVPVEEAPQVAFSQIFIGSCTNGSYTDLARAALIMRGRKVAPETEVLVSCPSRQVYNLLLRDGYLQMFTEAGARILECGCGPCMGIGQAPASGAVILRTSNRNYKGRSGTRDAQMYLSGTETAAASAITGRLTSAAELIDVSLLDQVKEPVSYPVDDSMLLRFDKEPQPDAALQYGSNIRPIPLKGPLEPAITGAVSLKLGDGVTTDDLVPPDPKVLTLRPNIPELSKYIFHLVDPGFAERAAVMGSSFIVAGSGYAQGSSREHAAIGCMYLGVRAVLAESMHRIHRSNLINYGVLPLLFCSRQDYESIDQGDVLEVEEVSCQLENGGLVELHNRTKGTRLYCKSSLTNHELAILKAGGLIPYIKQRHSAGKDKR